jgi:hypothetical protein
VQATEWVVVPTDYLQTTSDEGRPRGGLISGSKTPGLPCPARRVFPGGVGNTQKDERRFTSLIDDVEQRLFAVLPDDAWAIQGTGRTPRSARSVRTSGSGASGAGSSPTRGVAMADRQPERRGYAVTVEVFVPAARAQQEVDRLDHNWRVENWTPEGAAYELVREALAGKGLDRVVSVHTSEVQH